MLVLNHQMNDNCIGLIADSHGNLEATAEAIRILRARGAGTLVHLGDFCDSIRRDRAVAMIRLLRENGVLSVKGNNDFSVERMLADERRDPDPAEESTSGYLQTLPFTRALNGLLFAHSLPCDSLRAFYEPIDTGNTQRAARLFREVDFRLLFCGHSHISILFRMTGGNVTREQIPLGEKFLPDANDRFIVIVGAADEGECALYECEARTYERIRIFASQ
jgi:predicted phosphodiesterase